MDRKLVLENSSLGAVYTLLNTIIYLSAIKYFDVEQIYKTDLELKIRLRKIDNQMLYYGCKDSGLLCWKLKMLWLWLYFFEAYWSGQSISSSQLCSQLIPCTNTCNAVCMHVRCMQFVKAWDIAAFYLLSLVIRKFIHVIHKILSFI